MIYKIILKTLSDTLIGSGKSSGTIIDSDIVFDSHCLPYIPAKRIKGLFRNAAQDLATFKGFKELTELTRIPDLKFGNIGENDPNPKIIFENLELQDKDNIAIWLNYLTEQFPYLANTLIIKEYFTELRAQTAIDKDTHIAKEHSLRTSRVLKRGFTFEGALILNAPSQEVETYLAAICFYIKRIGTMRNRGFGKVKIDLISLDNNVNLTAKFAESWREKCIKH